MATLRLLIERFPALAGMLFLCASSVFAAEPISREAWQTSRVSGSPEPPKPYLVEPVFEHIEISQGLEIVALEGRLMVVERGGKIWSFPETDGKQTAADLAIDLKADRPTLNSAYGIAFHPNWKENHQVYISYTLGTDLEDGTKLSRFRFEISGAGVPRIVSDSEEVILTWRSGGHNGANLRFGPDGMLYVSTGDAMPPSPPDLLQTGQDNSDLLSCVLRIDVDQRDAGKSYRVPVDNPYLDRADVRPEIWAFGFRNPWKMSFDRSGRLWVGDVGWELWEMIFLVEKGGNYGWSAMEAGNPIMPELASKLAPISAPVAAHPHSEAASITGGFEYRGSRLPELQGAYIYADYETGLIWALRHDGSKVVEHRCIADTPHKIATFGLGNDGELYYAHYTTPTTFYRLVPNPAVGRSTDFPRKLSQTGLFSDVAAQVPDRGVYEFSIHEAMWQDGATATRYVALPGTSAVKTDIAYRNNGSRSATTLWPENAVLAKTIRLGDRPVETQMLHFDGSGWHGYSYRWNEQASDAELVDAAGEEFEVPAENWKGGTRYRINSRAECMRCHNMWNDFTPAFEPMQLAEFASFPRQSPQQVAVQLGLTNSDFFFKNEDGQLADGQRGGALEKRARSWLHANCAHCHRRHGGGSAPLEVNFERSLADSMTLWQTPTRGDFGLSDARTIVPGEPWRSVLNYRVSTIGNGHMPPVGPREVDERGTELLWQWIAAMPVEAAAEPPHADLSSPSAAMLLARKIAVGEIKGQPRADAIASGLASENQNIRALFERFRPADQRPTPHVHDPERILDLKGNRENGAKLLSAAGKLASCFACHRIDGVGGELGPGLTDVGSRLTSQQILESLTQPSKTIAPEYRLWTIETRDGEIVSGYQLDQSEGAVSVRLATGQAVSIAVDRVKSKVPAQNSLMPEGLLGLISEQEVADLLAYLQSLTTAPEN